MNNNLLYYYYLSLNNIAVIHPCDNSSLLPFLLLPLSNNSPRFFTRHFLFPPLILPLVLHER